MNNNREIIEYIADNFELDNKLDIFFKEESIDFLVYDDIIASYLYENDEINVKNYGLFNVYFQENIDKAEKDLQAKRLYLKLLNELI